MAEKNKGKYVFNDVEDVEKLNSEELKQYVEELAAKLAEAKADLTVYKNLWYKDTAKMAAIKEDVNMIQKLFNTVIKQW